MKVDSNKFINIIKADNCSFIGNRMKLSDDNNDSLGELGRVTVDMLHKVSKTTATIYDSLVGNNRGVSDVFIRERGVEIVSWVDGVFRNLKRLISPSVSISIVVIRGRNGVFSGDSLNFVTEGAPLAARHGKARVTSVLVDDGIPNSVEVTSTVLVGDPLRVTTAVTRWELGVDLSGSVEWLMDVTNVVDNKSEGEGASVVLVGEVSVDLVIVVGALVTILQVGCQVSDGIRNEVIIHIEGVVIKRTTFIKIWLVNEMPSRLERVTLTLDVVSESGAFNKGVVTLVFSKRGLGELSELSGGSRENRRSLLLKDIVSSSGGHKMTSAPPGVALRGKSG